MSANTGYNVDHLLGVIGEVLLSQREHKIAVIGAGRLGQAIANSPIFTEQAITIAAIFDRDPAKVGRRLGGLTVSDSSQLRAVVRGHMIVIGVLAVPAASATGSSRSRTRSSTCPATSPS